MRRGTDGGGSGAGRDGYDGHAARDGYGDDADHAAAGYPGYGDAAYDGSAAYPAAAYDNANYDPAYDDSAYDDPAYADGTAYDNAAYDEAAYADEGYEDAAYVAEAYQDETYEDEAYDDYELEPVGVAASGSAPDGPELSNQIFTIPNLISLARLAGVPVFLGLILSPHYGGPKYDYWALVILMLSGFSDWLDGKLARRWNQMTKLGTMLDPLADRLYIFATLVGFTIRGIIPLWLVIVLVGRDVALLVGIVPKLRKAGYGTALPVHFLGKAATFNLLYAFPLLLIGQSTNHGVANIGNIFGWAFVGWGTALYLWAGVLYFIQLRQVIGRPLAR